MGGGDVDAVEALAQALGKRPLVGGLEVGEQQADGHRLGAAAGHRLDQALDLALLEGFEHPGGTDALARRDAPGLGDQRGRLRGAEPVELGAILPGEDLPRRYAGFSTCFRREAGAAGKDTKGIFRVHQFDKVEMFAFVDPAESAAEHERLLAIEEEILGALTSCSNTTDFQARRLDVRFRRGDEGPRHVHTLNGTAVAAGRTIIALVENGQGEDGTVSIPEVLHEYGAPKEIRAGG